MTQAAVLLAEYALLSPSVTLMSPPSSTSASSTSSPSSSSSQSSISSFAAAELCELTDASFCTSPLSSTPPSTSLFLPPAKSTRSSLLHKRSSSTASTASTASTSSLSTSVSTSASYPPSPLPSTPPSMADVLPPSPSHLRIESGMVGLVPHFDAMHAATLSPSSTAATAQKPPLSPSSTTKRSRVNRALSQQPIPPSPTAPAPSSRRKRTQVSQATGHNGSPPPSVRQMPSQPMLHAVTSLPPLGTRSLSIPAHFRATSASSTLPQFPFRSIAHDVLSTCSPVSSPRMSAGPSRSPSPATSPLHAARRSSFSFHPLSPASSLSHYGSSTGTAFFPPSISASPMLLPQPNFDVPPPSPPPLAPSPHPTSSPSPTPSPPVSPSNRWQGRGKLPLSGKTADGVAMVSCATVAELLRGWEDSRRRKQHTDDRKQAHHEITVPFCDADTSSSAVSSPSSPYASSACSTPSPSPASLPPFSTMFDDVIILDCRFPYEFNGGHIPSAINITSFAQLQDILFSASKGELAGPVDGGEGGAGSVESGRTCLVFHCEFSQSRAPQYFSSLRRLNESSLASYTADSAAATVPICPSQLLSSCPYPDMYVMEGGYRRWVEEYSDLCEPAGGYVEMRDRRWREECGQGLKERKQEKRGEIERKRRRQQHGPSAAADDDCLRRITRSSTAAAALTVGAADVGMASPVFRRTSSCASFLNSAFSPIPLSLHEDDGGGSAEKEERRSKREKR